jgi:hypothetical protein
VGAGAEGKVPALLVGAMDVEGFRVGIDGRIAQDRQDRDSENGACGDQVAFDFEVAGRDARDAGDDGLEAQAFLGSFLLEAVGIGAEGAPLIRELQKLLERHAHGITRGVGAGEDEADDLGADLAFAHVA